MAECKFALNKGVFPESLALAMSLLGSTSWIIAGPFAHAEVVIEKQAPKKVLTSYGLVQLDSEYKKTYFALNQKFWKGVKVGVQNNQVQDYLLQHTFLTPKRDFSLEFLVGTCILD